MSAVENEVAADAEPTTATAAETTVETVQMEDGRTVTFAGKKRKIVKESIFPEDGGLPTVRIDFRNGQTRSFTLTQELLLKFAAHGAEQKLGDELAGETDIDDMVLAIENLISRLEGGEWSVKREAGGMSGTSVLIKALVEFSGRTVEQVKAFLKDKKQNQKLAMRNSPELKHIVERLEAEKNAKAAKVDTSALLASL